MIHWNATNSSDICAHRNVCFQVESASVCACVCVCCCYCVVLVGFVSAVVAAGVSAVRVAFVYAGVIVVASDGALLLLLLLWWLSLLLSLSPMLFL